MNNTTFRNYINKKYGSYFRTKKTSKEDTFLDTVRNNFIQLYKDSGETPEYMISISYYVQEMDLGTVKKNNKRINQVLDDIFNPRKTGDFYVSKNHFIERRERKLKPTSAVRVKNTITGSYEIDFNAEIIEGSFDTHHLIGPINDLVIDYPNSKKRIN